MSNIAQSKQYSLLEVSNFTRIQKKSLEHYCNSFLDHLDPFNGVSSVTKISSFDIQLLLIAHEVSKRGLSRSQIRDIIYQTQQKASNQLQPNFESLDEDQKRKALENYVRAL